MKGLTTVEQERRAFMICGMIVDGASLSDAGRTHKCTRQNVHQIRNRFVRDGLLREVDGAYEWTTKGRHQYGVMVYAIMPGEALP